jgi:hypothetical protein
MKIIYGKLFVRKHILPTQQTLVLLILASPFFAFAQFDSLGLNTKWCEGNILLNDNSLLKGYIRYNDKMGMISFRQNKEEEDQTFTTKRIVAMEYFDHDLIIQRKFASFNVISENEGMKDEIFFEIIMEFNQFAVLSKQERVVPAIRKGNFTTATGSPTYTKVGYEQFEKICLVGSDGKAEVVLTVSEFERTKSSDLAVEIKPYLSKAVLAKYTASKWEKVRTYIKENKLNLKKKTGLLMALEYYGTIEKEEM